MPDHSGDMEEGSPRRIDVQIFVIHPTMSPESISSGLDLVPKIVCSVGEPRKTPTGKLYGGHYPDTRWRHSVRYELREQLFQEKIRQLIAHLEGHKNFLHEIRDSGGESVLMVKFLGDGYFGDNITSETLARMVALKLDFGIEVFNVPQS